MKRLTLFAFLLLGFAGASAQNVFVIEQIEMVDNKVVIRYNLNDDNMNHTYLVQLFTSQDNFTVPLTKVSGDVGVDVKPGLAKRITWDATKEAGNFSGDISFEIRGRIYVPFVKLKAMDEGAVFKRGKNYPITWTSGNTNGQVNIELYKGDVRIAGDNNQPNVGKYEWFIPGGTKKGSDYRLKFTNTKDQGDVVYSQPFTIKPKIPLIVKAIGAAIVGGGIFFILTTKNSNGGQAAATPLPELTIQTP